MNRRRSPTRLSAAQEYVAECLFLVHQWPASRIAVAAGVGRRTIESALRRRGIIISRRSRAVNTLTLTEATAMFARAEEIIDPAPAYRVIGRGTGIRIAYRQRRCQVCQQVSLYALACVHCGAPFSLLLNDEDPEITHLRLQEENRL